MTIATKPVRRETLTSVRTNGGKWKWAPLIIELHPTFIVIRPKGKKIRFTVTLDQVYNIGARNAGEQIRKDRATARAARRKGGV